MSKKDGSLKIPKRVKEQFESEYSKFLKWAKTDLPIHEFMEYLLMLSKEKRTKRRVQAQLYSLDDKNIKILDRKKQETVALKRIKKFLYCEKDDSFSCFHVIFALEDKDVKKSLDQFYVWYITRAYPPEIIHNATEGSQKIEFEELADWRKEVYEDWVRKNEAMLWK